MMIACNQQIGKGRYRGKRILEYTWTRARTDEQVANELFIRHGILLTVQRVNQLAVRAESKIREQLQGHDS